jgi:hypothetical protein
MALEKLDVVDAMGIDNDTGDIVLTVIDAWDWEDEHAHLLALQEKINVYLGFIESGEVWDSYPKSVGKQLRIEVIFRYPPTLWAMEFLATAKQTAAQLDAVFSFETYPGNHS